jgi:membrane associated rhomboid family serine protease
MVLKPFHYALSLFSVRGFWVVLFYIAFDVVDTILGTKDNVAHWVHLGGFISGASIGLLLLFTRAVNCRGGDIVSALLGKHAWGLIGKPDHTRKALLEYGW